MNKLKNCLQKKVYVHKFYNENYPLSYKKTYALFFFILRFLMTLTFNILELCSF